MRIRTKLYIFAAVASLLAPVVGMAAYQRVLGIHDAVHHITEDVLPVQTNVSEMKRLLSAQQAAALAYVATGQAEEQQRFVTLGKDYDLRRAALGGGHHHDANRDTLIAQLDADRATFQKTGEEIIEGRSALDRNVLILNSKYQDISSDLRSIRARYSPAGSDPTDPASVPQQVRFQVNDLLVASEGMLHMVAFQWAAATDNNIAQDSTLRGQFDQSVQTFGIWSQLALNAGGPADQAIVRRVQSQYGEFETSARAAIAAAARFNKASAEFNRSKTGVGAALDAVSRAAATEAAEAEESSHHAIEGTKAVVLGFTLVGFVIAGGLGFMLAQSITGPLGRLRTAADAISNGDEADADLQLNRKDEIGELSESFQRMVNSLRFAQLRQRGGAARALPLDEDDDEAIAS